MGSRVAPTRIMCVNCNICVNKMRRYPALALDSGVTALICSWVYPQILFGFTCAAMLLVKDRKNLNATTLILVVFLSIFVIVTVMFVLASVLLLMAALDENPDLMSYYIWLSIVYLCVQLLLAIVIPLFLIVEGHYPVAIALIWMFIVLIVSLGWTQFISEVSSHRKSLLKMVDF